MDFREVVNQRHLALALYGELQGVGVDIGVAVSVATYPLAHAKKRRHGCTAQLCLNIGVKLGDFRQKSGLVIAHGVFNLVRHGKLGETQQTGLPQLQHTSPHLGFDQRHGAGGGGVYRPRGDGVAFLQTLRNAALGIQNTFALNLGGVGGQHR